jgi:hypothetical protein
VVVNNADPSNDEAASLFSELTVEGAITTLENLAKAGILRSTGTSFQRSRSSGRGPGEPVHYVEADVGSVHTGSLPDSGTPVTYCLLT